ncbi:unnamed protein product [Prunus armeniaca]
MSQNQEKQKAILTKVFILKKSRKDHQRCMFPSQTGDRTAGPIADKPGYVVDGCKSDLLKTNFLSSLEVFFLPSSISFPLSLSLSRLTSLSLYVKPLSQPSSFSFSRHAAKALSQPLSRHHASKSHLPATVSSSFQQQFLAASSINFQQLPASKAAIADFLVPKT